MKTIFPMAMFLFAAGAGAAEWIEVGADTEAKYYVDLSSIEVEANTVRVVKKGVFRNYEQTGRTY
jgi:hypothetical protein